MEPLSALSLFCNIVDICDHTIKVCKECRDMYRNIKGQRTQDEELLKYLGELQLILNSMRASSSKLNRDDVCKFVVGPLNRMEAKSATVKNILDGFRAKNPGNRLATVIATAKVIRGQGQLDRAVQELKHCQNDVHFAIAQSTRIQIAEISTQADRLSEGQSNILSGLTALDARLQNVDQYLQEVPLIVANAKDISEEVQTGLCAWSVLSRLGNTNPRYWDVAEADSHTFNWILGDQINANIERRKAERKSNPKPEGTKTQWELRRSSKYEEAQQVVNARLNDWLLNGSGLFHISGKPGSGKSTLMKYLVQHRKVTLSLENWAHPKRLALGRFFFWKPDHEQNSLEALMRGLLYSMIHFDAALVHSAFPQISKNSFEQLSLQSQVDMTKADIFEAFNRLVRDSRGSELSKFCFFIDGLDELAEERDTTHSQLVKMLRQWARAAKGLVKICVSSRQYPVFDDMPVHHRIRLQDLTRFDIINFVRHSFLSNDAFRLKMAVDSQNCWRLIKTVCENSDGVFLWVKLVVRSVERGLSNADPVPVLLERVRRAPRELEELFESLLDTIEDCHSQMVLLLLAIAQAWCAHCELSLSACRHFFLAEETSKGTSMDAVFRTDNYPKASELTPERIESTKSQLLFRCKGLLDVVPPQAMIDFNGGHVKFLHRTIPEFLGRWLRRHMSSHDVTVMHMHKAMCWVLWAEITFLNASKKFVGSSINPSPILLGHVQSKIRCYIRKMVHATMLSLKMSASPSNLSTTFQLLALAENALIPATWFSGHSRGSEGPHCDSWNSMQLKPSRHEEQVGSCPFSPSPLVSAAEIGYFAYVSWRLPRLKPFPLHIHYFQHCLEAASVQLNPSGLTNRWCFRNYMRITDTLIHGTGVDINSTALRCDYGLRKHFTKEAPLPSVFDAIWITVLFEPLFRNPEFQHEFFHVIENFLWVGALPRSVLCVGKAKEWFRILPCPPAGSGVKLDNIQQLPTNGFERLVPKSVIDLCFMISGQDGGIITLEILVAYAKPPNMTAILALIQRNASMEDTNSVDTTELTPIERLHATVLGKHGLRPDSNLFWI